MARSSPYQASLQMKVEKHGPRALVKPQLRLNGFKLEEYMNSRSPLSNPGTCFKLASAATGRANSARFCTLSGHCPGHL